MRGYVTLGDLFRARYGASVEALAVIILVPASIIWAAAQLLAFGQILAVVSGINLDVAHGGLAIADDEFALAAPQGGAENTREGSSSPLLDLLTGSEAILHGHGR